MSVYNKDAASAVFTEYAESPNLALSVSAAAWVHGLSGKPKVISYTLICISADLGFSVGAEVPVSTANPWSGVGNFGLSSDEAYLSNTAIWFRVGINGMIITSTAGGAVAASVANWALKIKAYR